MASWFCLLDKVISPKIACRSTFRDAICLSSVAISLSSLFLVPLSLFLDCISCLHASASAIAASMSSCSLMISLAIAAVSWLSSSWWAAAFCSHFFPSAKPVSFLAYLMKYKLRERTPAYRGESFLLQREQHHWLRRVATTYTLSTGVDSRASHGILWSDLHQADIRLASSLMFIAAFLSRLWWLPHLGQSHSRTDKPLVSLFR